uniref:Uncharacterized protein n=1 Tax=Arundo donax TaxID=35708 RepID=A0A0A8ZYW9_ARUDO
MNFRSVSSENHSSFHVYTELISLDCLLCEFRTLLQYCPCIWLSKTNVKHLLC